MKQIYRAVSAKQAQIVLEKFKNNWQNKYLYAIKSWENNFSELTSFYDFPYEIRKMIYTTNVIENVNAQLRRSTKTKGSFTNIGALDKIIYLKLLAIEEKWTKNIHNWGEIFNQLDLKFNISKYI